MKFQSPNWKRKPKASQWWFLLFWTLTFFSGLIVTGIRFNAIFDSTSTIQVLVTFTGFFIFTLAFYLRRRNKLIFDDVKPEITAP